MMVAMLYCVLERRDKQKLSQLWKSLVQEYFFADAAVIRRYATLVFLRDVVDKSNY